MASGSSRTESSQLRRTSAFDSPRQIRLREIGEEMAREGGTLRAADLIEAELPARAEAEPSTGAQGRHEPELPPRA
ncbi:hypothetical protein [Streptomyces sp. NPDC001530]|uniref:hypothetical protein n=1 Tax=Streptomyces sp. NPDC001530 TaxID=3364582 RepID=UPI0036A65D82